MKYYYELFFTKDKLEISDWDLLFKDISRLNGFLGTWNLYISIENNMLRFFIKSHVKIPSILSSTSTFIIKKAETIDIIKKYLNKIHICMDSDKTLGDIYDKYESKFNKSLIQVEIKIKYLAPNKYCTKTYFYFKKKDNRVQKYRSYFFIPAYHLQLDFSTYNRFFCRVDVGRKYLKINKSFELFSPKNADENLLEIDAFPYYQDDKYLNLESYDFQKHSLIVGASGTGKSKFLASFIKNIHDNYSDLYKIVMIDPHGAIEEEIGGLDNSLVIDMKTPESTIDILINSKSNANINTEVLLSTFKNILADQYNSKLERVLRHSIYILLKNELLTFENLEKLLTEVEFRNKILKESSDVESSVKSFFLTDFNELKNHSYTEAISPIISVIDELQMLPGIISEEEKIKISDAI